MSWLQVLLTIIVTLAVAEIYGWLSRLADLLAQQACRFSLKTGFGGFRFLEFVKVAPGAVTKLALSLLGFLAFFLLVTGGNVLHLILPWARSLSMCLPRSCGDTFSLVSLSFIPCPLLVAIDGHFSITSCLGGSFTPIPYYAAALLVGSCIFAATRRRKKLQRALSWGCAVLAVAVLGA